MFLIKAFACLVLLISYAQENTTTNDFEDFNRENDFATRFIENIRRNIPGEPDLDYPIYYKIPRTSFTCDDRHEGYYADMETRCQVFRICANTDLNGYGFSFLCPNGTLFSQRNFVCDWYRNVDCSESENYYVMNEKLGRTIGSKEEMIEAVKMMIEFPIKTANNILPKPPTSLHSVHTVPKTNAMVPRITTFKPIGPPGGNDQYQFSELPKTSTSRITVTTPNNFVNNNRQDNGQREIMYKKDSRPTTSIQITMEESQSSDLRKLIPPKKVYVSNLGELSTDVDSTFDPKTSRIFGDTPQQDTKEKNAIDIKLGPNNNQIHNLQTENLVHKKNSFSANINDLLTAPGTSKTYRSSDTFYESSTNNPRSTQSHESLTMTKRISTGLNGLANTALASDGQSPDNFSNKVYSREDKLVSQSFNRSPANKRPFGLAERINSAFQTNFVQFENRNLKQDVNNIETRNSPLENQEPLTQSTGNHFRQGRQFQFQGSGFTKSGATLSREYLPSPTNQKPSSAGSRANEIVQEITTLQPFTSDHSTIPSLLINVEDIDELDDLQTTTENSVHVKKRAERLLLQGVHLTLYDTDINDLDENTLTNNLANKHHIQLIRTAGATDNFSTTTPLTIMSSPTSSPLPPRIEAADSNIINPVTIEYNASISDKKNKLLPTTVVYSTQYSTTTESEKSSSKYSYPMHIRRQTMKPINFTKKPSVVGINTRTTSTSPLNSSKSRRRPTNRFSSKFSEQITTTSSTTEPTAESDLTPQANSYGARSVFNRINRNEANRYTILRRNKSNYDKQNSTNTINFSSVNNSTYSTAAGLGSTTKSKLNSNLQVSVSNQFNQNLRPSTRTRIQSSIQGTGSDFGMFKSFAPAQNIKVSSSYAELPGTSVVIAKSQEQGSFAISNDPSFNTGFQSGQSSDSSTVYHSLEEFLKNTFLNQKLKPQVNSHQMYQQQQSTYQLQPHQQPRPTDKPYYQHQQQKQSSQSQSYNRSKQPYQPQFYQQPKQTFEKSTTDFFPPFPTVPTTNKPTEQPFNPFPILSQHVSPYTTTMPSSIPRLGSYQTLNNDSGIDVRFGDVDTTHLHAAQRRLDVEANEKEEGRLYEGVSSYHVPLNSVGRLPGDVVARRKRS